jgi:hypothetical protein
MPFAEQGRRWPHSLRSEGKERILSLAGYPEVLLNGNGTGAGVTLEGIHRTLFDLTRSAVDG